LVKNIGGGRQDERQGVMRPILGSTEIDAVSIHLMLKEYKLENGQILESCLTHALWEARHISGRDKNTGIVLDPSPDGSYLGRWSAVLTYCAIIDQIGKCYKPIGKIASPSNSFIKALKLFTKLLPNEIDALYGLRNAFVHDFSLYNWNVKRPHIQHVFTVDNHPTNSAVVLPANMWDGKMSNRNSNNTTYINLRALGDLVENIYSSLVNLHRNGNLELILPGGETELLDRYIFIHF
jgi:hypothetical protein